MTREEAITWLEKHVPNKNLRKHMFATEAVMRELAKEFQEDEDLWGLAGLLHDLDYDQTVKDFSKHGLITAELLSGTDLPEEVINAIKTKDSKMTTSFFINPLP